MRTPRDRRERTQADLYPPTHECPACHQPLTARYHQPRWIIQLAQQVKGVSHVLECGHPDGERLAAVYRPHQEDTLALRGYTVGLEVVARIGERRDRDNWSITTIRGQLPTDSPLALSSKEVALRCEVWLAWVTTVAPQDHALIEPLRLLGGIVLAMEGGQPETSHETLSMLREVRSGQVWVAKTRLASATADIEPLIDEVLDWGLPIGGVISDTPASIGLAVHHKRPTVPQQMCPYHDLKEVAQPVGDADRQVQTALKKQVRGVRDLERQAEQSPSKEAQVVADYGLAMRTVQRDEGKSPLEPPGLKLYQNLPWPGGLASLQPTTGLTRFPGSIPTIFITASISCGKRRRGGSAGTLVVIEGRILLP